MSKKKFKQANKLRAYLREWRLVYGYTMQEMEDRTGRSKSDFSRIENGNRRVTIEWINIYARALELKDPLLLFSNPFTDILLKSAA